jgi:hypothetical protein
MDGWMAIVVRVEFAFGKDGCIAFKSGAKATAVQTLCVDGVAGGFWCGGLAVEKRGGAPFPAAVQNTPARPPGRVSFLN